MANELATWMIERWERERLRDVMDAAESFLEYARQLHNHGVDDVIANCAACGQWDDDHRSDCPVPVVKKWLKIMEVL